MFLKPWLTAAVALVALGQSSLLSAQERTILNSSYDIARELFADYNPLFIEHWQDQTGETIAVEQSHAGSSTQARAILQGLSADVVTYNQVTDIDILAERGRILPADWQTRLPNASSPYFSAPAFLVRAGNPLQINGWDDLLRSEVDVVFPNPKTSGNGRYTYLAALGHAQNRFPNDEAAQHAFLKNFLANVAVFDTGGRGATNTFVERGIGDVLITFESETNNIADLFPDQAFEVVVPAISFKAEFPVAWLDRNIERNGTADVAREYVEYLYSEPAQRLLVGFNYRVSSDAVMAENADRFPDAELLTIDQITGGWDNAMTRHFGSGGVLDQLLQR